MASPLFDIGNANGAPNNVGITNANRDIDTGFATRLASSQGGDDAAQTASSNQHASLPPRVAPSVVLTRHRHHATWTRILVGRARSIDLQQHASASTIQRWLRHHFHRRRCIQHIKVLLTSLAARATTIQRCFRHLLATSTQRREVSAMVARKELASTAALLEANVWDINLSNIVLRADILLQFWWIKTTKSQQPTPHEFWHLAHPEPYTLPPQVACPYILPPGLPPPIPG